MLLETAISGEDHPVPALERSYLKAISAEPSAARKLSIYAAALGSIQPRFAPLARVLAEAARQEPALQALWTEITTRRADNMRRFALDLQATGSLRSDLSIDTVARERLGTAAAARLANACGACRESSARITSLNRDAEVALRVHHEGGTVRAGLEHDIAKNQRT